MKKHIICKLTGDAGPAVDAHIIPKAFYDLSGAGKTPIKIVKCDNRPAMTPSWTGEYDNTIVTTKGESHFLELDNYASNLLVKRRVPATKLHSHGGVPHCIEFDNYDFIKLKLFFISLLWRAGVSSRPFFSDIKLGQYEGQLKEHIIRGNPGEVDDFSIVIGKHIDTKPYGIPIAQPSFSFDKTTGHNFYTFHLGHCVASIKFDHRPCPVHWRGLALERGMPLRIVILDRFEGSDLFNRMKATVQKLKRG